MKKLTTSIDFIQKDFTNYFHFGIIFVICLINLGISNLLRTSDIFFVANPNPIGFNFGYYSTLTIIILATWILIKFNLLNKRPVYSIFILAGLYSNFIEKLIWNNVADYLIFINWNLNLADIQIFLGVIMINLDTWFKKELNSTTTAKPEIKK